MELRAASTARFLRGMPPKRIVLSGPSGFLGQRVLACLLKVHTDRLNHGLKPGEVVLLSSSPGRLMERLSLKYGASVMRTIRASRVDYYTQHDEVMWTDQLLSLGLEGEDCVFVNLAAVAGPVLGINDAMMHVNYRAPVAAARACESLKFGHWIQSSTQATSAERAGQVLTPTVATHSFILKPYFLLQSSICFFKVTSRKNSFLIKVPYSRGKAMADSALARMDDLPVTIASLGLLYCKTDGNNML